MHKVVTSSNCVRNLCVRAKQDSGVCQKVGLLLRVGLSGPVSCYSFRVGDMYTVIFVCAENIFARPVTNVVVMLSTYEW